MRLARYSLKLRSILRPQRVVVGASHPDATFIGDPQGRGIGMCLHMDVVSSANESDVHKPICMFRNSLAARNVTHRGEYHSIGAENVARAVDNGELTQDCSKHVEIVMHYVALGIGIGRSNA